MTLRSKLPPKRFKVDLDKIREIKINPQSCVLTVIGHKGLLRIAIASNEVAVIESCNRRSGIKTINSLTRILLRYFDALPVWLRREQEELLESSSSDDDDEIEELDEEEETA